MENINPDILSEISKYLNWFDTFNLRLLSKDINNIFKYVENDKLTLTKESSITKKYSFKKICIRNIKIFKNLEKIHTLNLRWVKVINVCALRNVHTLDLSHTNVTNVSALGNIYILNLSGSKVIVVSALSSVYNLNLCDTAVPK